MANEKLKIQLEEKDKTVQNLRRAVEHLELKAGERNFADMQVWVEVDTMAEKCIYLSFALAYMDLIHQRYFPK